MVRFYLGKPPAHIENWIKNNKNQSSDLTKPLCFTAQQANSSVTFNGPESSSSDPYSPYGSSNGLFEYRKTISGVDSGWLNYNMNTAIQLPSIEDKVEFRAKTTVDTLNTISNNIQYRFVMTGKIAASGNIQSLLDKTCARMDVPEYCYYGMFYNCQSLIAAPELPATQLADCCYNGMFNGCQSLIAAPELPATQLAAGCYDSMFYNCSSLAAAPELPATQLAGYCYSYMFQNCSKFTKVHMKESMNGVYNTSIHGDITKNVDYDL